jgi:hypothetical protein
MLSLVQASGAEQQPVTNGWRHASLPELVCTHDGSMQVGASVLSRALGRLPPSVVGPAVIAGLATPDDAALIR